MHEPSSADFHKFVEEKLSETKHRIIPVTEELLRARLKEFKNFVNSVRSEYSQLYGWQEEDENYFLNPLVDKWKFSYCIIDENNKLCLVNFSSIYGNLIHNHFTYVRAEKRNLGFAKLHMIKLSQTALDHGFNELEGCWPKNNITSIILYLKMGWQIEKMRDENHIILKADSGKVRNITYKLLIGR